MNKKKRKLFWYFVAIGFILIFLLILVSSIINIGERLRNISKYLEYSFYGLCILLIWFLIINPIRIILFSPSLSIATTLEKDSFRKRRIYRSVRKNILNSKVTKLTDEEKNALSNYDNYDELRNSLNIVLNGSIKKTIRRIIIKNAKTVMLSTAISQNSRLDMFSVVAVDLKLVKEIVVACGFRPSMKNLSKLTVKVGTTALIAEGLENLRMEDILPSQMLTTISNIPFLKPIMSSFMQGVANALMTIRIGLVTRGYLFSDGKTMTKNQIRIEAFKDSVTILPQVIGEVLAIFPSKIVKLFTKKKDKLETQEIDDIEE